MEKQVTDTWELFSQPIYRIAVSKDQQLTGYELLIRSLVDNQVPFKDLQRLTYSEEGNRIFWQWKSKKLHRIFAADHQHDYWINIDPVQFAFQSTWEFLRRFASYHDLLKIEVTERPVESPLIHVDLQQALERLVALHYQVAIDDVGTGQNQFSLVQCLVPWICRLKLSLLPFTNLQEAEAAVTQWSDFAVAHHLEIVIEAVCSAKISKDLIQKHRDSLQQGFYFGEPYQLTR